ncbi:MAG: LamG domain-containing protein, partial [Acidobacteriota bacterium]
MIFFRLFSSCLLSNTLSFGPRRPHTPRDSVPTLHLLLLVLLASSPVAVASPVAHWTLDDGSGSSVLDLSGNGLHGQLSGTTQWLANGAMDGALDLVAPGHVRVTDSGSGSPLDLAHELTLLVWVKPAGTGGTQSFISKDNVYELEMGHGGADRYSVRLANLRQGRGGTPLVVGAWQHVGVVWNGAQVTYFYNGRVDGADPYSGTLPANDAPLGLGGRPGASPGSVQYGLAGALDDVRIYNRALSEAEIRSIHAGGEPSPGGEDTTPPTLSNGAPTGVLAAGTTWVDLTWITSESAECRFDSVPGRPFGVMAFPFDVTGGSFHRTTVGGLSTGSHTFYARCRDLAGNANTDDAAVSFVIPAPGARPPLRSVAAPQGVLAAGTGGVPLTLTTDVAAECRYATDPGIPFADMPVTFQQTGGTSHSAPLAGLSDGFAYAYFVRCVDLVASGGANADDLAARVFVGTADEASFHPTDVSGLQFFVESRSGMTAATCDTESCRTAGDNAGLDQQYCDLSVFPQGCVRRWRDQSGFSPTGGFEPPEWTAGRDFGQDDLDKPGLIYDCIGGLPCARGGAGANQDRSFEIELGQEVGPVNGPFSAWILARPVVQPQDFYYWGFAGSELAHRVADDALSLRVAFGPGVVLTDPGAVTPGQWQLIEIHRAADDSVRAVVNGTDVTAGQPSTPGNFRFRFLMSVSRVHGMYGDMAAAMVFDRALGEAERQELRGYFSDVYGVGQGSGSGP